MRTAFNTLFTPNRWQTYQSHLNTFLNINLLLKGRVKGQVGEILTLRITFSVTPDVTKKDSMKQIRSAYGRSFGSLYYVYVMFNPYPAGTESD